MGYIIVIIGLYDNKMISSTSLLFNGYCYDSDTNNIKSLALVRL